MPEFSYPTRQLRENEARISIQWSKPAEQAVDLATEKNVQRQSNSVVTTLPRWTQETFRLIQKIRYVPSGAWTAIGKLKALT